MEYGTFTFLPFAVNSWIS